MNPKGSLAERVLQLEGDLYAVKQELRAANHRAARIGAPNNFRLARITNTPSTSDNTFEVIFLDGKFTQAAGVNSPSYTDRQLASRATVYNITGVKLDKDDVIPVYSWSNRFWTYVPDTTTDPGGGGGSCEAQIFQGVRYWEIDPGGGAVTEVTGTDAGKFIQGAAYGTNGGLAFQGLSFTNQYGTDLGIDFVSDGLKGEAFDFQEDGIYQITVECNECSAFRKPGASAPSTQIGVYSRIYIQEASGGCWDGLNNGDTSLELAANTTMSGEDTAGTMSHPDGTATLYHIHPLVGSTTVYIEPSTNSTRRFIMYGQVITESSVYDGWGARLTDINVVIKRLDTDMTAINV